MSSSYLTRIRRRPCLACGADPAGEAHHTGRHGVGQKPPDELAVPLCHSCHMALHDLRGPFRGFERRHIKAWEAMAVKVTLASDPRAERHRAEAASDA